MMYREIARVSYQMCIFFQEIIYYGVTCAAYLICVIITAVKAGWNGGIAAACVSRFTVHSTDYAQHFDGSVQDCSKFTAVLH